MKITVLLSLLIASWQTAPAWTQTYKYPLSSGYMMQRDAGMALAKIAAPANISDQATIKVLTAAGYQVAQDAKAPYPRMAPVDQYMMERSAEIALARTAAPESISGDAEVMVLGQHGYETAVKGKNGFVCMVQRSWFKETDDPEFWNPKLRAPICFNPAGARFNVPVGNKRTELILAGRSAAQMSEGIEAAFNKKELPMPEAGAMCYMMSKQQYLGDSGGHWHPHVMFFVPLTDPGVWGADLQGSPVLSARDTLDRVTVFMIPVRRWSDGTADAVDAH